MNYDQYNMHKLFKIEKKKRLEYIKDLKYVSCKSGSIRSKGSKGTITSLVSSVEDQVGVEADNSIHKNISERTLWSAGLMFSHLSFCPPLAKMKAKSEELETSINIYTAKELLVILSRLVHATGNNLPDRKKFTLFLDELRKTWNPKYDDIMKLTGKKPCTNCKVTHNLHEDEEQTLISKIINHPVHVLDEDGILSPSSYIPFCWLGKKKELGIKNNIFSVSACDKFKPKLRNEQICYEMDIHELLLKDQIVKDVVLYFLIDQNKDRQYLEYIESSNGDVIEEVEGFMVNDGIQTDSLVYLDTIGKQTKENCLLNYLLF